MFNNVRTLLIVACVFGLVRASSAGEELGTSEAPNLRGIADPHSDEIEVLRLMKRLRLNAPTKDEAVTWRTVANSGVYADARRRWAVLQIFDRHAHLGMTLGQFADALGKPSWLRREDVAVVHGLVPSQLPIDAVRGEAIFVIAVRLPRDFACFVSLRVASEPSEDGFFDTLQGKRSDISAVKVTAIAILTTTADDRALIGHRGAPCTL